MKIEMTPGFRQALDLLECSKLNVFVTGRAGTGKSTLLQHFRSATKKSVAVLAPTGVAAVNVGGQTIHSFFKFKPDITFDRVKKLTPRRRELYQKLDAVIIDEVSMVRADLFDCVCRFLEMNGPKMGRPFGGVQVILFGDLYQLPPVVKKEEEILFGPPDRMSFSTSSKDIVRAKQSGVENPNPIMLDVLAQHYASPYFFSARSFDALNPEWVELEDVFRQQEGTFLDILNAIRNDSVTDEQLDVLNRRVRSDMDIATVEDHVFLTTTNNRAGEINGLMLDRLPSSAQSFVADVRGDFEEKVYPTQHDLQLKEGAQVMLLNNDSVGRWVNGTIGKVRKIRPKDGAIDVLLPNGQEEEVTAYRWDMFRFELDPAGKKLEPRSVGQFVQLPVKLAWAITIHKSQGLTFDKAVLDLTRSTFAHGQLYVALSRLRSLDGLVLTRPVARSHILLDECIRMFLDRG